MEAYYRNKIKEEDAVNGRISGTEDRYVGRQFATLKSIANDGKPFTIGKSKKIVKIPIE